MATLGADLQHARELAGLSLDDLSARTKIRRHMLESIERNEFSSIPGGLLARGYLRAYAGEVGLPRSDRRPLPDRVRHGCPRWRRHSNIEPTPGIFPGRTTPMRPS